MELLGWGGRIFSPLGWVADVASRLGTGTSRQISTLVRNSRRDAVPRPSRIELQIGEAASGAPTSVAEVVKRLEVIYELAKTSPRGEADGIACFTHLYQVITENVLRWLDEGRFKNSDFLETLDLEFAQRYFQALRAYVFDRPSTPMSWRVVFDNRSDARISRLHFAAAGVNAHINFDLALAVVSTCERLGVEFGDGDQHDDYLSVNQIFAANTLELREKFETANDPELVDAVEKLFDDFAVVSTRELAWRDAERMWPHRLDTPRMAQETWLLDQRAALLGKGMLANPLLH